MKAEANKKYKIEYNDGDAYLTRDEMIGAILEFWITIWILGKDIESLEEMLRHSDWKALDKYTDEELKSEFENYFISKGDLNYLLSQRKERWEAEVKAEKAKKNGR